MSTIDLIKQKILEKNDCFFLPTGKSYSVCTPDFQNHFASSLIKISLTPVSLFGFNPFPSSYLRFLLNYSTLRNDYTLIGSTSANDYNVNNQLYLFVNKNNIDNLVISKFPLYSKIKLDVFPNVSDEDIIVLDKFFFTSNGMIYVAKDENTIYKIKLINREGPSSNNMTITPNLEYESTSKNIISTIKIPTAMTQRNIEKTKILSIWNYDFLPYGQVENKITNNTEKIRDGWFCQTGGYTREDGRYMDCDDDGYGRFCIGRNGGTEFLFNSDNDGYRCRNFTGYTESCGTDNEKTLDYSGSVDGNIFRHRVWCQYRDWGFRSESKFGPEVINACAEGIGNDAALPRDRNKQIIASDRLSYAKCKLMYSHSTGNDNSINVNASTEAWAPWSKPTSNSQIYFDFASEHDTVSDRPMYEVNSNCQLWIQEKPERLLVVKNMYCTKYPESTKSDCGKFCAEDNTRTCKQTLLNFCKGSNLEYKNCKDFAQELNINLDQEIKDYCQSMSVQQAFQNELCGCFMSQDFYSNYFGDLKAAAQAGQAKNSFRDQFGNDINIVQQLDAVPDYPICYYANCATSGFLPATEKSSETKKDCPDVTQCIQVQNITNTGNINADEVNYGSQTCILTKIPGTEDIDCIVSDWIECVDGKRSRTITTYPENNGKKCPELTEDCGAGSGSKKSSITLILIISIVIFIIILGIYIYMRKKRV